MADKKTPEELARSSFSERVQALSDKLFPTLLVLFGFSWAVLSIANYLVPESAKTTQVEVEHIQLARKFATDSRRLFNEIAPTLKIEDLSAETKSNMADLAGALAATESLLQNMEPAPAQKNWIQDIFSTGPFTQANAQDADKSGLTVAVNWMRQGIVLFMIVSITLLLLGFLILYFKTSDPEKLKFADSMIRMIVGFYIGVVTGLLGIPPV